MHEYGTTARDPETRRSNALRSNEIYLRILQQEPLSGQVPDWIWYIATNLHNVGNDYYAASESAIGENKLELLRKAIAAFREGGRFCAEQAQRVDRRDRVLFPLALNERYLCCDHRDLAKLLRNSPEGTEASAGAIEWGKKAVADFRGSPTWTGATTNAAGISMRPARARCRFFQCGESGRGDRIL